MLPHGLDPTTLSDPDLVRALARLADDERAATAVLIAHLAEFDARRLYLGEGCPSLFAYCTERLHLSEHAAYHRIETARAVQRFPQILERLCAGDVTLTAIGLLRPHLTEANCREVLEAARHLSKRGVEELVARLAPRPDLPTSVRKIPDMRRRVVPGVAAEAEGHVEVAPLLASPVEASARPPDAPVAEVPARPCRDGVLVGGVAAPPSTAEAPPRPSPAPRPGIVRPVAPARYAVQMTVSAETYAKLRRAQDLLGHVVPNVDVADVFDRALTLLLDRLERATWGALLPPLCDARMPRSPRSRRASPATSPSSAEAPTPSPAAATPAEVRHALTAPPSATTRRSRHIPAAVRREVWRRDGGQCTFVGRDGQRCTARRALEFHHREPFATGGPPTASNLTIHCRLRRYRHNLHSFAMQTVLRWAREGVDLHARLPVLSTYLGHVAPSSTYWYLTATPELLQLTAQRVAPWQGAQP